METSPNNVVAFRKPPDQPGEGAGGFDEKQVQTLLEAMRQASDPGLEALKPDNLAIISAINGRLSQFGVEMAEVRKLCKGQLPVLYRALKQAREAVPGSQGSFRGANDVLPAVLELIPDAPVNRDHVVPDRWILRDESPSGAPCLCKEVPSREPGGEPTAVPASHRPIVITARIRNVTTGNTMLEVAWKQVGVWHKLIVEREQLFDASRIVACTANRGFPVSSANRAHLIAYLADYEDANAAAMPLRRVSRQMGWVSGRAFLAGEGLLTTAEEEKGVEFRAREAGEAQLASAVKPPGVVREVV